MSIANFIPEIWSDSINETMKKTLVLARLCTQRWSGEIASKGDTVHILGVTTGSVAAYDPAGTLAYGDLSDSTTDLVVSQADSFSFGVDDIDKQQSMPGVVEAATTDYAYKLDDKMEKYLFSLCDSAAEVGSVVDCTGDAYLTVANVSKALGDVVVAMDVANVPSAGRWGVVSPAIYNYIVQAKVADVQSESAWGTGEAASIQGITLFKSNNVVQTTPTTGIMNLFGQGDAIALAQTIVKVEAIPLVNSFRDGVRGLNVYGAKVVNKNRLVILKADLVAPVEEAGE